MEVEQAVLPQVTAGLRGANWDPALMRQPYTVVPYSLQTADGQKTLGFLFTRTGKETCVVSIMHPREMSVTHYLVPTILDAGCACWVQGPRSIGNDLRLEHEIALFDVAAGMSHLRALDFQRIVLLGNSGGGRRGWRSPSVVRIFASRWTANSSRIGKATLRG